MWWTDSAGVEKDEQMSAITPNEMIALEAFAKHGDAYPVQGAAEVLRRIRERIGDIEGRKFSARAAREFYEEAAKSGIIQLAQRLLPVHKEHAPAELATRTNLTQEQAAHLISLIPQTEAPTITFPQWSAKAARKWLMSYARSLSNEAKYIRENADGFAENEEEFRCGLANGLGIDDEEEQNEIIEKFLGRKEK